MRAIFLTYRCDFSNSIRMEKMLKHKLYKTMNLPIGTVHGDEVKGNCGATHSPSPSSSASSCSSSSCSSTSSEEAHENDDDEDEILNDEKYIMDWILMTNVLYVLGDEEFFKHWNWRYLLAPWREEKSGKQMFLFYYLWGFIFSNWIGITSTMIYWKPIDDFVNQMFPIYKQHTDYFTKDLKLPLFRSYQMILRAFDYGMLCREDALERGAPFIAFYNKIAIIVKCFPDCNPLSTLPLISRGEQEEQEQEQ